MYCKGKSHELMYAALICLSTYASSLNKPTSYKMYERLFKMIGECEYTIHGTA